MAQPNQDSFQQYKKYLQESLGISSIAPPPRPLTPYLRFYFERTCEEKSKGNKDISALSRSLSQEWKNLEAKKKEYFTKTYEIRLRERDELLEEYEILSKKKKLISGYSRYYKLRFKQIKKENSKLSNAQISQKATNDWKNLPSDQKQKFNKQAAEEKATLELTSEERQARAQNYNERIKRFEESLREDKIKVLKKYGLDSAKEKRKAEREKTSNAKILQREIERVKREEQRNRKRQEQKDAKQKAKEEEKQKKEEERRQKKQEQKKKKAEEAALKKEEARSKSKPAKEPKQKKEVKKAAKKTKTIKKAAKPKKQRVSLKPKQVKVVKRKRRVEVKKEVKQEEQNQVKVTPKKQAKPAPMATRRSKRK